MASWVAWLTANTVFTIVAFHEGSYLATTIDGIAAAANVLVIIASIKQKVSPKPGDFIDWLCLCTSVACIAVVVIVPQNKTLGAVLAMLANVVATIPTLRHAWTQPSEETWQLFAANAFAAGLGVGGIVLITGFNLVSVAGPLIAMIGNTMLVMITAGRGWITRVEGEIVEDIHAIEDEFTQSADEREFND